jgi:hypothetical protein
MATNSIKFFLNTYIYFFGITPAAAKKPLTPNEAAGILVVGTAPWEEQLAAITVVKQSNLPNTEKARAFRVAMQNKFSDVHRRQPRGWLGSRRTP